MTFRKFTSLSMAMCFAVLMITGILSYMNDYSRITSTLHTVFGLSFCLGVVFHIINNFQPIRNYTKGRAIFFILSIVILLFTGAFLEYEPFKSMMDYGAKLKANEAKELNISEYEIIEHNNHRDVELTIDLLRSKHYWNPQMAIWLEDIQGNFLESIFVSKATAKGLFFGGRNKSNFKEFDERTDADGSYRRVEALPIWSHKRGMVYQDGMYAPTSDRPLSDGITGATITDNFQMVSSINYIQEFILNIEINVAFDDNENFSEFDFPNDSIYHNGTGQMGQPSIIFKAHINLNDNKEYYLMDLVGHGHHSGQTGLIYSDMSTLTTALEIVERIVVGVKKVDSILSLI